MPALTEHSSFKLLVSARSVGKSECIYSTMPLEICNLNGLQIQIESRRQQAVTGTRQSERGQIYLHSEVCEMGHLLGEGQTDVPVVPT